MLAVFLWWWSCWSSPPVNASFTICKTPLTAGNQLSLESLTGPSVCFMHCLLAVRGKREGRSLCLHQNLLGHWKLKERDRWKMFPKAHLSSASLFDLLDFLHRKSLIIDETWGTYVRHLCMSAFKVICLQVKAKMTHLLAKLLSCRKLQQIIDKCMRVKAADVSSYHLSPSDTVLLSSLSSFVCYISRLLEEICPACTHTRSEWIFIWDCPHYVTGHQL